MQNIQLAKGIYWVGAIDWDLRYFHGYVTQAGSTYNSYLIIDEKVALIDTVKTPFKEELLKRVSQIIDLDKIDYLVSLHVEMDHSGSIPYVLEKCKNAKLVTTQPAGIKGLESHYGKFDALTFKTGESISLGKRSLQFICIPMVHWPDNTMAFMPEEGILFSTDAFGQHYASTERFDDQVPKEKLFHEAGKYYANIVMPYGAQTLKALNAALPLKPKMLAPAHGLIWRTYITEIVERYFDWAEYKAKDQALVVFDSMWHSTEKMAEAILDGFHNAGIEVIKMSLQQNHISDIVTVLQESKYVAIGSPTMNNNILPTVGAFLTYIRGLAPKNRVGIAFGSYGWSGQSPNLIQEELKKMGWEMPLDPIRMNYIPGEDELKDLTEKISALVK